MRPAGLLFVLLLVPLAAAEPGPTVRQCADVGCVIVKDADGDGAHDWANVGLALTQLLVVNANANRTVLLFEVVATSDEVGGPAGEAVLHAVGEAAGTEPDVHTAAVLGSLNATSRDGGPGFHDADVLVVVLAGDHETGAQEAVLWRYARVYDGDGDGVPDGVDTRP